MLVSTIQRRRNACVCGTECGPSSLSVYHLMDCSLPGNGPAGLQDIHISKQFESACLPDAELHCPATLSKGIPAVVECLSAALTSYRLQVIANQATGAPPIGAPQRPPLSVACERELRFELLQSSESIHLDPSLEAACKEDYLRFCSNVPVGRGRVSHTLHLCLRS